MGLRVVEDENHFLYECDLYSKIRSKLITNLSKIPDIEICENLSPNVKITMSNIKTHLMTVLSPNIIVDNKQNNSPAYQNSSNLGTHPKSNTTTSLVSQEWRSYAVNCICTYLLHCFEERRKLTESVRKSVNEARRKNEITVNLIRGV